MPSTDPLKDPFLVPRSRYYGRFSPENLAFNANLQEFALRVNTLCGLETGGKITADEVYREIKHLWHQLADSYSTLEMQRQADLD